MYIPDVFQLDDQAAALDLMRTHNFALLVTARNGAVQGTHLPLLIDEGRGPQGTLLGHMARANPHWHDFAALAEEKAEALVVFQGPHAYISPNWYESTRNVPTWNYVTVHVYGTPRLADDEDHLRGHLEQMVATHERGHEAPWSLDTQDEKYLSAMRRGIVAFEIPINRIEAKAKLSQNKADTDRLSAAAALEASGDPVALDLAARMRAL